MDYRRDPTKWRYWGRWNQVMLFTAIWLRYNRTEVFRRMGLLGLGGELKVLHGHYYFLKEDGGKLYKIGAANLDRETNWFDRIFEICNRKTRELLALENKRDLKRFIVTLLDFLGCSALVELLDFCMERYLKQLCGKKGISFEKLLSQMTPPRETELMKFQSQLKRVKKEEIGKFVKKFKWVGTHAFEGRPLSRNRVLEELKFFKTKKGKRSSVEKAVGPATLPELKRLIGIGSELAFQRSNLMETIDRVAYSYWEPLKAAGKERGLTFQEVVSMTQDELLLFLDKGAIPLGLQKRKKEFGVVLVNNKIQVLLGEDLEKEMVIHQVKVKAVKELKGMVAFPGKVKGAVKILQDVKDVAKVKEGDIIVAAETTPDYVLALRKAAAFVTNQGGITSHAAIVSRELKKPCIIGTKVATKVLKDGDLVEVDAEKGVVRILKKG